MERESSRKTIIEIPQNGKRLATLNLAPNVSVYGEHFFNIHDRQYRAWDPYRSKLAAALMNGLTELPIIEGSRVLYLGASTGTTVSHISDIVGEKGIVFAVEMSARVGRELVDRVAAYRKNVLPIIEDARRPEKYVSMYTKADILYCDIAQPQQTEIAVMNARMHLKNSGDFLLLIKARSIDSLKEPKEVFRRETVKLEERGFQIKQLVRLEPFDKDHILIHAKMLKNHQALP